MKTKRTAVRVVPTALAGLALALSGLATSTASAAPAPVTKVSVVKGDASFKGEFEWRRGQASSYATLADACRSDKTGSVRVVYFARVTNSKDVTTEFQTGKACRSVNLSYLVAGPRYGMKVTGINVSVCNMVRGQATSCAERYYDNPTV